MINRLEKGGRWRKRIWLVGLGSWVIIMILVLGWWLREPPMISPIGRIMHTLGWSHDHQKSSKVVMGFLPYWQFSKRDNIRYELLTHLAVFGVGIDDKGQIIKREKDYTEPGWAALNSTSFSHVRRDAKTVGTKILLVITAFDEKVINSIIANADHTDRVIEETIQVMNEKQFDGVNIDFEHSANTDHVTRKKFTEFVKKMTEAIKTENKDWEVSVDVFGDSYLGRRIWEIEELAEVVDQVVIMAYDYHLPNSDKAGPVAPLYGAGEWWSQDITTGLAEFSKKVEKEKLVLGVPYYGYEWATKSNSHLSPTYQRSGRTATYMRVRQLMEEKKLHSKWDSNSMSPWIVYEEGGEIRQIYFEDETSLGLKFDLAKQSGLGGVAIWAMGYDDGFDDLWELVAEKFF